MKQRYLACLLGCASWFALAHGHAAPPAPSPEPAPEMIRHLTAFRATFTQSLLAGRPDPIVAACAEQVRLMPEYQRTIRGKADVAAYHRAFLARFEVRACERRPIDVTDLGTRVVEVGHFTMELAPRAGGAPLSLVGKYLDLWSDVPDAAPTLLTAAWNFDGPVDGGEKLHFPEVPAAQVAFQAHVPVRDPVSFELAALNLLHGTAITQRDAPVWSQFFADDAILLPNHHEVCRGRAAIDRYIAAHVPQLPVFEQLDIRNDQIDVTPPYIIEYASHVANWRRGDASGVSTGKNLRVWRRGADGALQLFRQIGMYD